METRTINLGGKRYKIRELPRRDNSRWRARLRENLEPVVRFVEEIPTLELRTGQEAAGILRSLLAGVDGAMDQALDALLAYSPDLEADRERLEAEAHDSEIMSAFVEVLGLAFPFGSLGPAAGQILRYGQGGG